MRSNGSRIELVLYKNIDISIDHTMEDALPRIRLQLKPFTIDIDMIIKAPTS